MRELVVVRVDPFAPGSESAEVTLSCGEAEVVAFCFPCFYRAGDRVPNLLHAMDGQAITPFLSDWPDDEKQRLSEERIERKAGFGYQGCGSTFSFNKGRIVVCGFVIELGELPWDGPVEFDVERLDLR